MGWFRKKIERKKYFIKCPFTQREIDRRNPFLYCRGCGKMKSILSYKGRIEYYCSEEIISGKFVPLMPFSIIKKFFGIKKD